MSLYLYVGTFSCVYLLAVKALRWRRYNAIHGKYTKENLTPEDAQVIIHLSMSYDMPALMVYSLEFALFKTFAIVSNSQTLSITV